MRFYRSQRVESLIQSELGKLLVREVEFPFGSLVTITTVEVDKKMDRAKVLLSVIPAKMGPGVLKMLTVQAGRLQFLLLKKINIKPMPRIMFELDHGLENAAKVEQVLNDEQVSE